MAGVKIPPFVKTAAGSGAGVNGQAVKVPPFVKTAAGAGAGASPPTGSASVKVPPFTKKS